MTSLAGGLLLHKRMRIKRLTVCEQLHNDCCNIKTKSTFNHWEETGMNASDTIL